MKKRLIKLDSKRIDKELKEIQKSIVEDVIKICLEDIQKNIAKEVIKICQEKLQEQIVEEIIRLYNSRGDRKR